MKRLVNPYAFLQKRASGAGAAARGFLGNAGNVAKRLAVPAAAAAAGGLVGANLSSPDGFTPDGFTPALKNLFTAAKDWQYTPHALAGLGALGTIYADEYGKERNWLRYLPWLALMGGGGLMYANNLMKSQQP